MFTTLARPFGLASLFAVGLCAALASPAQAQYGLPPQPKRPYEEVLAEYRDFLDKDAFYIRARGIRTLAETKDTRAFAELAKYLKRPQKPKEETSYLVADVMGRNFMSRGDEFHEIWKKLLKGAKKPRDAWLRMQAYTALPPEVALADAKNPKLRAEFRAAAVFGLAARQARPQIIEVIESALGPDGEPPKKEFDRAVLVEAFGVALGQAFAGRRWLKEEGFLEAALLVIDEMERADVSFRTKLGLARAFGKVLNEPQLYLQAQPWRLILQGKVSEARQLADEQSGGTRTRTVGAGTGVTTPRFFGIEGTGKNVVFVIDLSDSMLTPLNAREKQSLGRPVTGSSPPPRPRRPRTGDGADDPPQAEPSPKPAPKPKDLPDLDWSQINNRFEAAREVLKLSLKSLGENMEFGVVLFGQRAESLFSRGLLPAKSGNIEQAIRALESIRPGPPTPDRPDGVLRGNTNLHGALRLAFRLTSGGIVKDEEHVDEKAIVEGAQTIFLLSDGVPSWDDYDQIDVRIQGIQTGDPETGKSVASQPTIHYFGPYVSPHHLHLQRDVERMNAFRRAELHVVAFGFEQKALMEQLCKLGDGYYRQVPGNKVRLIR